MLEYFSNLYIWYYYGSLITCGPDWAEKDAVCSYSKMYYIMDGECEIEIGGVKYPGKKGMFFLIPAGTAHSFYHINENYVKKYWFHFSLEAGGNNLFDLIRIPYCCDFGIDPKIIAGFEEVFCCSRDDTVSGVLRLKAEILSLVSAYILKTGANELVRSSEDLQSAGKIVSYINENLNRNITVSELAGIVHLHPNYFIRFFKKQTGLSPVKYINRQRMERAKMLLENTKTPMQEIMESTGFEDASHFSKFFKQYTGYSPRKFREFYKNN